MNATKIANKLVSGIVSGFLSLAIIFPLSARADYYLVYGPPEAPAFCDSCAHTYYRPVHRHRVHHHHVRHYYYPVRRHSHYTLTVYYPVPTYVATPCTCCGGFIAPTYIWVPAPYGVYYTHPDDRLVGNSYEEYDDSSVDTGTADNDVY